MTKKIAIELIERGTIKAFQEQFANQPDIIDQLVTDSLGMFKGTLLHYAVNYRKLAFVKYFVSLGADIESTLGTGHSPLYEAILSRSTTIAQYLIDNGANVHTVDANGRNLFYAITKMRYGDRSTMKVKLLDFLLSLGLDVNEKDRWNRTILYELVQWNEPKVLNRLLEGGAEVNIEDIYGYTPLHVAAGNGWVEMCQLLLKKGAVLNQRNQHGWTALDVATMHGARAVIGFLGAAEGEISTCSSIALMTTVITDKPAVALELLKKETNLNLYDYSKLSLLRRCIRSKYTNLVKEILSRKGIDTAGALSIACFCRHVVIVEELLHYGANPNENCGLGSPFYNLLMFGKVDEKLLAITRLLLDNGAVFNANETGFRGVLKELAVNQESVKLNDLLGIQ